MSYYLYRLRAENVSYIGQARTAHRALSHLTRSSNRQVNLAVEQCLRKNVWPDIVFAALPIDCHGDLGIAESALIQVDRRYTSQGSQGQLFQNANKQVAATTRWFARGEADGDVLQEYPKRLHVDRHTGDELRSFKFCRDKNFAFTKHMLRTMDSTAAWQAFHRLPQGGDPIKWTTFDQMHKAVRDAGAPSVFVVPVNSKLVAGRAPIGPGTSEDELADRCLKWWKFSAKSSSAIRLEPPQAIIAVMGSAQFRFVMGAWALNETEGFDLKTYAGKPRLPLDSNFCGLQGRVLEADEPNFHQARWPIWWMGHDGNPLWVGSN